MSAQSHLHAVNDEETQAGEFGDSRAPDPVAESAAGGATPPGGGAEGNAATRAQKQRSARFLPTDRLSFDKQVEVLRVIAQLSGPNKRSVTAEDLSAGIGLKGHTGGLSNKFFRDTGWVVSTGRGTYAATDELLEYNRHLNIDAQDVEGAKRYLVPAAQASWYWDALEPILDGGLRKQMALLTLSKAAGAYDHTDQLELILTWLEWLRLVRWEGDLIFRATEDTDRPVSVNSGAEFPAQSILDQLFPQQVSGEPAAVEPEIQAVEPEVSAQELDEESLTERQAATPTAEGDTSALVSFTFSVRITSEDAAKLSPEQLQSVLDFAEKLRG